MKKNTHRQTAGMLMVMLILTFIFSASVVAESKNTSSEKTTETIGVQYRGHVENYGNMPKPEGTMIEGPNAIGTRGQGLRVEGFWIALTGDVPEGAKIVYQVHVQNKGWMNPVENGDFAGTEGKGQRVESVKIHLENLTGYDVYYRGHVQNLGDMPRNNGQWGWVKNGEPLGTTGLGQRLEELQVQIVKQSNDTPDPTPAPDPTPMPDPEPTPDPESEDLDAFEARVLELVNEERISAGLSPLATDATLNQAAEIRAGELTQVFSHTRPNQSSCFTVLDEFNISYRSAGENIAAGYGTPEAVVNGWMNSPGHRANILGAGFTKLGNGYVAADSGYGHYWAQLFISD